MIHWIITVWGWCVTHWPQAVLLAFLLLVVAGYVNFTEMRDGVRVYRTRKARRAELLRIREEQLAALDHRAREIVEQRWPGLSVHDVTPRQRQAVRDQLSVEGLWRP